MSTSTRTRRLKAIAAVCAFGLLAVACGDDDDTEGSTAEESSSTVAEGETAGGEYQEYCDAVAELDSGDSPPTADQFERLKDVAPEEISSEVTFVADAFIAADGDMGKVFSDPEVEEQLGTIEDWEAENCDDGDEFAVAPENEEYCAFVEELDGQDGPPTAEQMDRLKEIRPDAIGEDTDMVADAFIAADGDIGQVFSDPAIEEAFGRMEEHDAEVCGFETAENEEEEVATEPLEGAEVIPVTAVEYAFEGIPAQIAPGPVSFELTNEGEVAHEMGLARLGEGVDLDELLASGEEPSPDQAEELGFTFAPPGEGGAYLNVEELTPGTYAVVCFIPGPEGKAHHELGMKTTFTVG